MGLAAGAWLLSSCKSLANVPVTFKGSQLVIKRADMGSQTAVVLRSEKLPAPVYLLKDGENYSAVLMLCTHKQCELNTYGKVLHCPCHGSEFSQTGEVLQGPADQPLTKFLVSYDNENIYIQ